MGHRVRRIVAISAVAVVLLIAVVLVVVQLPSSRARVFRIAAEQLAARYDLDLRAARLDYNVLTRVVTLSDVRLAAVGHDQEPFLTASRIQVALPWSIFRGILAFDRIELDDAKVDMVRRADGSSNLPERDQPSDAARTPLTLDIGGLVLRALDFAYVDERRKFRIDAGGLHANLQATTAEPSVGKPTSAKASAGRREASGPIEVQRGVQVQIGERRLEAQPISGRMAFDGSSLTLEGVGLATREATITVGGKLLRVLDEPTLALMYEGTADLSRAADWGTLPLEIGGSTAVRGTIDGPAAEPTIKVDAKSDAIRLGGLERAAVDASVTITPSAVVVDRASVRAGSGVIDATTHIEFGEAGTTDVKAEWRDLDAATALRVIERSGNGTATAMPYGARLASSMTGRMTLQRRGDQPMTLTVENRAAAPGVLPPDSVPLSGTLALDARDGRWTARQSHALGALSVDGTIGGRIADNDFASASIEGALAVESVDVAAASDAIEHLDVDLPDIASDIHGPLHATVNLAGRVNALEARAAVSSEALVVPGVAPAAVQATVAVTPSRVDVPMLTATIGRATLTGHAIVDLAGKSLAGTFSLDAPEASELLTSLPENAQLSGPIAATATLSGAPSAPDVHVELQGSGLTLAGQPVDRLATTARITSDTAFIDALTLTAGTGTVTGTGSYVWGKRAYTAKLQGTDIVWRGQIAGDAETEVRVTQLTFAGNGTIDRPGGAGKVAFELAGGTAGDIVQSGEADIQLNGESALVDARVPSLGAHVKTTILTHAPYTYDATADIAKMDLAPFAALAGLPAGGVLGRITLSATAHGDASNAAETTEVSANLQQVAATVGEVPIWLPSPSKMTWRKDDLRIESLTLGFGSGMLTASGRLAPGNDAQWTSTFNGELGDLIRAARGVTDVPAELSAGGALAAKWQSTGGIDRSSATLTLTNGQVTWADVPPITALALQAGFDGTTITLSSLTGTWQDGGISGTATLPRALVDGSARPPTGTASRGHAQVKVTGLTQAALAPWVEPDVLARIVGRVSASFDADILGTRVNDIAGTLVLDEAVLNLADIEVQQAHPTKLGINDARVTMDDVSWTAGGGPLALTGSVALDAPKGPTLDLALKGDLNLGLLSAFAPTTWTAGSALVDVKASGLASDPDVQGRVELVNGEVAVFNPRLILYELNGPIALDRQRVRFGGVAGSLNGGTIRLDGQLGFGGGNDNSGQLIIELGQVALEYPTGLQSEVNGLLTFAPRGPDWQLGGDVRIARSSYKENISLPALAAARRSRPPVAVDAEPTFLDRLRLNLFVITEEDLSVDNNYGRIAAGAGVRVIGTANEPAVNGRVTMREGGQVYLAGRTFRLERGAISFTNPSRIEPELDIELRTLAGKVDVAVTLSGTMDQLKTEVRSTSPERTDKEAQEALYGGLGTEDAATLLSAELLGVTGRAVGLDSLRIERGVADSEDFRNDPTLIVEDINSDPSTRLTLSKRVRPDVEVIISRSLQESGGVSAAVSYKVRPNIELRASQRENTDRAIALRHEINFGGGQRPRGSAAKAQPEVATIRITGEPGQPEAEIRTLLHLKEGDRFAFHDWQSDVDRIKASYTERGYYEARVRPTRENSADNGTVALTYRIDQGPKTNVVIDGHPLHADLLRDLQDAWSRAIFDRFLIDDVRARVAADLMNESYVGSKVDPIIERPNAQTKQLRVVIKPGTHVSGRDVRFAGNQGIDSGRLEGVIDEQSIRDEVWQDQSKLKAAIETFYREQGYLAVKVSAGAPTVEGDRGVLPVTVAEGRRFLFAKPTLQGVGEARLRQIDQALSAVLHEGVPYDAAVVDQARQRVERFFLSQGFNNARIDSRSTSDEAAGTVTVAFNVAEGLQQVLREVTTEGDDRTRDGVVRRALRLMEGAPVDLSQWAQARKRMYDTNVFAQVDIEPVPIAQSATDMAAGIEPVRAVVRVVEYPAWRLRYGLQLNDQRMGDEDITTSTTREQNVGVLSDIQNRNLFGRAIAGGLAARIERNRQIASLFGSNGSFFGLPIRTQAFLFTSRLHDPSDPDFDFLVDRVGTSVEQRWQAFRRTEVVYAYRYDQTRTYENVPNPEIDGTNHTGKVTAGLIFDRRNDAFSATKGSFTSANYEHAARILGGDSRNSKVLVQQYYFHPLGGIVLASRAQIGVGFGRDPLVREDRFFLGGATTVRGYTEDGLGARDALGPLGGHAMLLLNQEARFPIKGWLNGVGFIDAGNVFEARSELSFSDLSVGYGFGIRLDTPFAMLRVDFGVPGSTPPGSTRQPNSLRNGRWYIGIGHIF